MALLLAAVLALVGITLLLFTNNGSEGVGGKAQDTCREAVVDHFRSARGSPILEFGAATANFTAGETADFYVVNGSVDRKPRNGVGGSFRNRYTCKLTAERDGTWRVNDLTFTGG